MSSDESSDSSPKTSKKGNKSRRKKNFTDLEVDIVIEGIVKYDHLIHGPESIRTSQAHKQAIYQKIADKVNAVGVEVRSAKDIRIRWNDLKRRTKKKLARAYKKARKTGGGPPSTDDLTPAEERIAGLLHPEQVVGLEGIDSGELRQGSSMQTSEEMHPIPNTSEVEDPVSDVAEEEETSSIQPPEEDVNVDESLEIAEYNSEKVVQKDSTVQEELVMWVDQEFFDSVLNTVPSTSTMPSTPIVPSTPKIPALEAPLKRNTRVPGHQDKKVVSQQSKKITPSEWEANMLEVQNNQRQTMVQMLAKVAEVDSTLQSISQALCTGTGAEGGSIVKIMNEQNKINDSMVSELGDISGTLSALTSLTRDQQDTYMDRMTNAMEQLAQSSASQAMSLKAIATSARSQSIALVAIAAETKAVAMHTEKLSETMRQMSSETISVIREQGRHSRRLQRQHMCKKMHLHGDVCNHLGRIATGLEISHISPETASRSTTPSEDVPFVPPPRASRTRKGGRGGGGKN